MNPHRVEGASDWDKVPPHTWNSWQKLAARTHGLVTIGNFFSLLGLLSIPIGLILASGETYLLAAIVLALGRICDLLDGWLADKTGTKSPLGEKIDASSDKISTAVVLIGLVMLDVMPGLVAGLLVAPHVLIAPLAIAAFVRGKQFHPSRDGKYSMAAIWVTILLYVAMQSVVVPDEGYVWILVQGVFWLSVGLGLSALFGYTRELFASVRKT